MRGWEEAVKFADKDLRRYSVFQLGQINRQLKLNMVDDAAKAIKAFELKRLDPDYKDEYEFLKKRAQLAPGRRGAQAV